MVSKWAMGRLGESNLQISREQEFLASKLLIMKYSSKILIKPIIQIS